MKACIIFNLTSTFIPYGNFFAKVYEPKYDVICKKLCILRNILVKNRYPNFDHHDCNINDYMDV